MLPVGRESVEGWTTDAGLPTVRRLGAHQLQRSRGPVGGDARDRRHRLEGEHHDAHRRGL